MNQVIAKTDVAPFRNMQRRETLTLFFNESDRRCSRGRFASLIPVGLAPDIPFTRPWAAMPPTATPPPDFTKTQIVTETC